MKTILICPNQAHGIPVLADSKPLVSLPLLGEHFICYWLEYLASRQVKEVRLITSDDATAMRELVGSGERWGLTIEIFHEVRDLDPSEARKRYRPAYEADWLPEDVIEADHLPGLKEHKIFATYESWFRALGLWLPYVCQNKRVGLHEIQPGVWAGARTRIARNAVLKAPSFIGDNVRVGKNAVVGPFAFLEDAVVIDEAAEVTNSWVGPETFVGTLTRVSDSLGWGDLLVNWKTASHTVVPDEFLLSSLAGDKKRKKKAKAPATAPAISSPLARPFEAVISMAQKIQG